MAYLTIDPHDENLAVDEFGITYRRTLLDAGFPYLIDLGWVAT